MKRYWLGGALVALTVAGCSSHQTSSEYDNVSLAQLSGQWQVESIDQGGIIDNSHVTVLFSEQGRISGSTSCNRYSANLIEQGKTLKVDQAVSTRMACAPALMKQEQRFLSALKETVTIRRLSDTWLVAEDASGTQRLKMIEMVPTASKQDAALDQVTEYSCRNANSIANLGVRFVGPDTVELLLAEQALMLPRVKSASGVKYSKGHVSFWNKGAEATLASGDQTWQCRRAS